MGLFALVYSEGTPIPQLRYQALQQGLISGRSWQITLATSSYAVHLHRRGMTIHWTGAVAKVWRPSCTRKHFLLDNPLDDRAGNKCHGLIKISPAAS